MIPTLPDPGASGFHPKNSVVPTPLLFPTQPAASARGIHGFEAVLLQEALHRGSTMDLELVRLTLGSSYHPPPIGEKPDSEPRRKGSSNPMNFSDETLGDASEATRDEQFFWDDEQLKTVVPEFQKKNSVDTVDHRGLTPDCTKSQQKDTGILNWLVPNHTQPIFGSAGHSVGKMAFFLAHLLTTIQIYKESWRKKNGPEQIAGRTSRTINPHGQNTKAAESNIEQQTGDHFFPIRKKHATQQEKTSVLL